jgi:hypothetical protein
MNQQFTEFKFSRVSRHSGRCGASAQFAAQLAVGGE